MSAKRVAFINGKGGCGKTTSIFHVAGVLAKRGEKILVIDLDKQRNTTSILLMNTNIPGKTVLDFMTGKANAEEVVAKALFQTRGNAKPKYYGVDVIGSDIGLQNEANLLKIDGGVVGKKLDEFIKDNGYTWLLIDMPPSNMVLNNICFKYLVDYVVIPSSSDIFSVDGYGDVMDVLDRARKENPTLNIVGMYLARYMKNCGLDRYIREQLLNFETFIDVQIPLASDVREAVMFGRPISYYKTFSESKTAYEKLVKEMEKRMG
jgi:hypothetical protein